MSNREEVDFHKPIFLTGSQRSGSSWTAKVLSSAARVAWLDEPFNHKKQSWGVCAVEFPKYFTYVKPDYGGRFRQAVGDTFSFNYNLGSALRFYKGWRDLKRIGQAFRKFSKWRRDGWRPLVKQPTGLFMAEWIAQEFGAQVVVLVRHPAGYVNSRKRLGWGHDFNDFLSQPSLMADYLVGFEEEIRDFAKNEYDLLDQASVLWRILYGTAANLLKNHPDWILVRYEDLALAPEKGFEQLFGRLGLDFSENVRQTITYHGRPSGGTGEGQGWKSLIQNGKLAATKWQNELSTEEIGRVYERVGDVSAGLYGEEWW